MIWTPRTTVASVIEQDSRFLVVEEQTLQGPVVLNQPAGHLEEGEGLVAAVIRETLEETGWRFTPERLVGIYRWRVPVTGTTYIRYCFSGSARDHDPGRPLDDGILATHWLTLDELRANRERLRSPMVTRCIEDHLAGAGAPLSLVVDLD